MCLILAISILIRLVATVWSVVLLRRIKDWRMGFLTVMLGLMTMRQILTLLEEKRPWSIYIGGCTSELPALIVSIMALLAIFFLVRIITERKRIEKLEEMDRLKSEFLATMSHELRTPLNSIIGFTGIILKGMTGEINKEQRKQLSMVYRSAKHLLSLINGILDLSKIESGKMEISRDQFKVKDVVSEVTRSFSPMISQKGLRLVTDIPDDIPEVRSDRKKVFQILLNLVGNAVKFTETGEIRIGCRVTDNQVEISVSDTGTGIKKENMELLFEAFRQIDGSAQRKYQGSGLGLYLCKKLVSLLGGTIRAESEYGKGSTFIFTLPLKIGKDEQYEKKDTGG